MEQSMQARLIMRGLSGGNEGLLGLSVPTKEPSAHKGMTEGLALTLVSRFCHE